MSKIRVNISISQDTAERLKQFAFENHMNVSQVIEQLIWAQKVKNDNVRGQMNIKQITPI